MGGPAKTPRTPGSGRPKGRPNKITADVRAAIMAAFDQVGGVQYLKNVAKDNPAVFCSLLGKLVPKEINANVNVVDQYFERLQAAQSRVIEHERAELKLISGGKS